MVVATVFTLVYPIGIPVIFFVLLWRDERQRQSQVAQTQVRNTQQGTDVPQEQVERAAAAMDRAKVSSSMDFLRKDYQVRALWQVLLMLVEYYESARVTIRVVFDYGAVVLICLYVLCFVEQDDFYYFECVILVSSRPFLDELQYHLRV